MDFWTSLLSGLAYGLAVFFFIAALTGVFLVLSDLFRDRGLNGWAKAAWTVFIVLVPLLATLIYVIARGRGMAERRAAEAEEAKASVDAYIRETATPDPARVISEAHELVKNGALTETEFVALKNRVLTA